MGMAEFYGESNTLAPREGYFQLAERLVVEDETLDRDQAISTAKDFVHAGIAIVDDNKDGGGYDAEDGRMRDGEDAKLCGEGQLLTRPVGDALPQAQEASSVLGVRGTTGAGKTHLADEIARCCSSEWGCAAVTITFNGRQALPLEKSWEYDQPNVGLCARLLFSGFNFGDTSWPRFRDRITTDVWRERLTNPAEVLNAVRILTLLRSKSTSLIITDSASLEQAWQNVDVSERIACLSTPVFVAIDELRLLAGSQRDKEKGIQDDERPVRVYRCIVSKMVSATNRVLLTTLDSEPLSLTLFESTMQRTVSFRRVYWLSLPRLDWQQVLQRWQASATTRSLCDVVHRSGLEWLLRICNGHPRSLEMLLKALNANSMGGGGGMRKVSDVFRTLLQNMITDNGFRPESFDRSVIFSALAHSLMNVPLDLETNCCYGVPCKDLLRCGLVVNDGTSEAVLVISLLMLHRWVATLDDVGEVQYEEAKEVEQKEAVQSEETKESNMIGAHSPLVFNLRSMLDAGIVGGWNEFETIHVILEKLKRWAWRWLSMESILLEENIQHRQNKEKEKSKGLDRKKQQAVLHALNAELLGARNMYKQFQSGEVALEDWYSGPRRRGQRQDDADVVVLKPSSPEATDFPRIPLWTGMVRLRGRYAVILVRSHFAPFFFVPLREQGVLSEKES